MTATERTVVGFLFLALFVAVVVIGAMMYNMNSNMRVMDENIGKAYRWAQITAKWAKHVNEDHLRTDHEGMKVAPDHIQPPPDPPW
jgi:hypothetical protein